MSGLINSVNKISDSTQTVPLDGLAELIAQMDAEKLEEFITHFEIDLDDVMEEHYNRMVKRARTYTSMYFGLLSLLLMNDYTAAREVMLKAESNKLDSRDIRIHQLLIEVANIEYTGKTSRQVITSEVLEEYRCLYEYVSQQVRYYDLSNGYFRRNTKSLKNEWDDLVLANGGVNLFLDVPRNMYKALWLMLKFRIYIVAMMPKVEV